MTAKKHILVTSSWYPSDRTTAGIVVMEQAEALARLGHRVTLLYATASLFGPWLRSRFAPPPRYDESELLTVFREHIVFPFPARLFRNPEERVKQYIADSVCARMARYFRKVGPPDVIHQHCLSDNAYLAEAISRATGAPYVFTEYSNYYQYSDLNKFNWFETFDGDVEFVRNAAARIAATEIRARGYEEIFDAPFVCIPNLVVDLFAAPRVPRLPGAPFTFICVAVLDQRKRQDLLLRAFAREFRGTDVRLSIVGNGPLEAEYKAMSAELGLGDQVTFWGKCGREEVRRLFDTSHVGVLPSDQETFAIVLAEAMFRGLPVVSTRSGGPEEVVTAESGWLTPTGDEDALAAKMREIHDHYDRYDPERIRASAMERYSARSIALRIDQVYDQIAQAD